MDRAGGNQLGIVGPALLALSLPQRQASGQLFENLEALGSRLDVGLPFSGGPLGGPKGIWAGDSNGGGKPDLAASNLDGDGGDEILATVGVPGRVVLSFRGPVRQEGGGQ